MELSEGLLVSPGLDGHQFGKNEMRPERMNLLPLRTGLSLSKPGHQMPEILGVRVRLVAEPPHLGMERWQFAEGDKALSRSSVSIAPQRIVRLGRSDFRSARERRLPV